MLHKEMLMAALRLCASITAVAGKSLDRSENSSEIRKKLGEQFNEFVAMLEVMVGAH